VGKGLLDATLTSLDVKATLIEVKGNPSMVCRFRHDERRHAGSALSIEIYGANHAHGLN
jgi:hypothetical protein